MARHRSSLRSFLEEHRHCIFCGGDTPATTQDHVPSRQLFSQRWWPEGYVFPACTGCNRAEQVVSLLALCIIKNFSTIISPEGAIVWKWFTNAQRLDGKVPEIASELNNIPILKRTSRNLGDQFSYNFGMAIDGEAAGYFVAFRRSFAILGIVDPKGTYPELSTPGPDVLRPLSPPSVNVQ